MLPEDRVLVGVIKRKVDLMYARDAHWYRIPQEQMPRGVDTEYVAFFLSRAFGERNGAIHYFARKTGLELHRRRDLLPDEPDNPHADAQYYRVALGDMAEKIPPIENPTHRRFAFIHTTWDRFVSARKIADLYSENDFFVDRIYYALRRRGLYVERSWEAQRRVDEFAPGLHILCENGINVVASVGEGSTVYLDQAQSDDAILQAILGEIARNGGAATVSIPPGEDA